MIYFKIRQNTYNWSAKSSPKIVFYLNFRFYLITYKRSHGKILKRTKKTKQYVTPDKQYIVLLVC